MTGAVTRPALAAYAQAAGRLQPTPPAGGGAAPLKSFGQVLEQTLTDAVAAGRKSEALTGQAAAGKADLTDVVQAVTAAELTLQSVVAVRDRMIAAYQEIMRMPI
jgi:flagellar hook-basal body complex protein FliE